MIELAPGDSLAAVLNANGNVGAMAFGEQVPVGGGPPQPIYAVATLTTSGAWVTITGMAAGQQGLINKVILINNQSAAVGVSVQAFIAATGGYVSSAVGMFTGGANSYLAVPGYGMAIHGRNGWRVFTQYGNDVAQVQQWGRCYAPSQTLGAGGNLINSWTTFQQGTLCAAAANGLTVSREGCWLVNMAFRLSQNVEHYLSLTLNGGLAFNDYPAGSVGAPSGAGYAWSTIWNCSAGDVLSMNCFCASAPSAAAQGTTQIQAHWLCPFR